MSAEPAPLHTLEYGDHGPRVVFCHGLFGQGRNWSTLGRALADEHRVTLVDLPHHGRSPWRDRFDYVAMADEIAGLLDPADPVTLVGHSMGGKAAMIAALRHPERIARLCVVDIAPVAYAGGRGEFEGFVEAMNSLDLAALPDRAAADAAMAESVEDPGVRAFLLQNLRREGDGWRWQMNLEVLGAQLGDLGGWPEAALADVAPYDGPVLWIAGADSRYVRDEHTEAMRALFPQVHRVRVKNAGHWVHSEQPAVFEQVLRRFLAS